MQNSIIAVLLTALFAASGCVNYTETAPALPTAGFKLANGSPISDAVYDDYSPIMLQLANGTLALVFASTRPCAGCSGHNVFVASSIGTYANNAIVPAFNAPQVITANATALNYPTRLRLAATVFSNNINIFVKDTVSNTTYTGMISPVSVIPINVGSVMNSIINSSCASGTLLGVDATGLLISTPGPSGPISRYDYIMSVPPCPTNTFTSTASAPAVNISFMRSSAIGISEGFLVTETSGNLTAQTAAIKGPLMQIFMTTMAKNSLFLTSATVFQGSQASGDLIVFSAAAASGQQSDMYMITDRTPATVWLKYTNFGAQPVP